MSSTCRSCEAPITWARTASGRAMPLDANPTTAGNVVLDCGRAEVLTGEALERARNERVIWMPHHATCPSVAQHRTPAAPSHTNDPETSIEAAEKVNVAGDRALVLESLRRDGPATDFELGERTGRRPTSVGTRRGELVKAGLVEFAGTWRPSPSGNRSRVWRVVP